MEFESLHNWLSEQFGSGDITFNQLFRIKNKWVPVQQADKNDLVDDFFKLVDIAYAPIGGHLKVNGPEDLKREDWDVWHAIDIDEDPDADVVLFAKRTPFGVKLIGVGHDGAKKSRMEALYQRADFLGKNGTYLEASGKTYMILRNKFNIDIVRDPKVVQAVLDKPIQWHGRHPEGKNADPHQNDAWYSRKIGDKIVTKIMMGKPILDVLK